MSERSLIPPELLKKFPEAKQKWLLKPEGLFFYHNFIREKGCHLLIIGNPGSGKTRKMAWFASYLCRSETVVWFDSCKDNEAAMLFSDDFEGIEKHFIIPFGSSFDIRGIEPSEWTLSEAVSPSHYWDLIIPGAINIFSIDNFFYDKGKRSKYIAEIYKNLVFRAYHKQLDKKIGKLAIFNDEFQKAAPSQSITNDPVRLETAQAITENVLEVRAFGIRIIGASQDYDNIWKGARRNLPAKVLCRGAVVRADENPRLFRMRDIFNDYRPEHGLFVSSGGKYFPRTCPWTFRVKEMPGLEFIYEMNRFYDEPEKEESKEYATVDWRGYSPFGKAITELTEEEERSPSYAEFVQEDKVQ